MKKQSTSKRTVKAMKTKKKIFEAARHLIIKYGIENLGVDSIVEVAGVSKGTFYVHFESKDALLAALVNDYTQMADMEYSSFLNAHIDHKSVFEILLLLAEEISSFIEGNIGIDSMRALYKAHLTKTIDTTSALSYNRKIYELLRRVLEKGVHQGELREDISIDSLAKHLIMSIRGIVFEWCVRYPNFNLKEQVLDHFEILLYGLKK